MLSEILNSTCTIQSSVNRYFPRPIQDTERCFGRAIKRKFMLAVVISILGILFYSCNPDDDGSTDSTSGATSQNSPSLPNQHTKLNFMC